METLTSKEETMGAEDTVMKAGDLCIKVCQEHRSATLDAKDCTGLDCEECQLKAQAGISFKAGYDEAVKDAVEPIEKAFSGGKKAGIKEVVKWVSGYLEECHRLIGENRVLITQDDFGIWQAKLKEWGLKD